MCCSSFICCCLLIWWYFIFTLQLKIDGNWKKKKKKLNVYIVVVFNQKLRGQFKKAKKKKQNDVKMLGPFIIRTIACGLPWLIKCSILKSKEPELCVLYMLCANMECMNVKSDRRPGRYNVSQMNVIWSNSTQHITYDALHPTKSIQLCMCFGKRN